MRNAPPVTFPQMVIMAAFLLVTGFCLAEPEDSVAKSRIQYIPLPPQAELLNDCSTTIFDMSTHFCSYGSLPYEGQTYKTVAIGTQTWMAENLNYNPGTGNSTCYDCITYGRLYDWSTAMNLPSSCNLNYCSGRIQSKHRGICPSGWHIPSQAEWNTLSSYVQSNSACSNCDARLLKATSGWNRNGNGIDLYGFSALPGGGDYSGNSFDKIGYYGNWWSASEDDNGSAFSRTMNHFGDYTGQFYNYKSYLFSVRCVQD